MWKNYDNRGKRNWDEVSNATNMIETNAMLLEINKQLKDCKIEFIGTGGFSNSKNDMEILKIGRKT